MASSDVEICNVALVRVDRKTITGLDDGSPSGNACDAIFGTTRDDLLRSHDWNFARARQKLARLVATPAYEFDYSYQLPTDYLSARGVHDNEDGAGSIVHRIEGDTISASAVDVYLTYTKLVTNASAMPPVRSRTTWMDRFIPSIQFSESKMRNTSMPFFQLSSMNFSIPAYIPRRFPLPRCARISTTEL